MKIWFLHMCTSFKCQKPHRCYWVDKRSRALVDEFLEILWEIARVKNEKKNPEIHEIVRGDWDVTIHVC